MKSRSLVDLCCLTQANLFQFCLAEEDLRGLGLWRDEPGRSGLSPAVWCRVLLHRACHASGAMAGAVSDLLDLRHLDAVVRARCSEPDALAERVEGWVRAPDGAELPGLLWSLCTDPRDDVHALGARLGHEAAAAAARRLVGSGAAR